MVTMVTSQKSIHNALIVSARGAVIASKRSAKSQAAIGLRKSSWTLGLQTSRPLNIQKKWRFPEIGVPLVIIHLGCGMILKPRMILQPKTVDSETKTDDSETKNDADAETKKMILKPRMIPKPRMMLKPKNKILKPRMIPKPRTTGNQGSSKNVICKNVIAPPHPTPPPIWRRCHVERSWCHAVCSSTDLGCRVMRILLLNRAEFGCGIVFFWLRNRIWFWLRNRRN